MPGGNAGGEPQVQLQEIFGLLFAVLCGLLLGLAAAPSILPMLGFAGFTQSVEPGTAVQAFNLHGKHVPTVGHAASANARPSHGSNARLPSSRLRSRYAAAANTAPSTDIVSTVRSFLLFQPTLLYGFGLLALAMVLWLRRDMFAVFLCRWAKDPRQWRDEATPAVVNARCVLHLEGNSYQLGAEFFTQAVEVRISPLFVRVNARGSERAIVLPRRMPRLATTGRSSTRRAAAS
jgi:hypothetical protein